MSSFIPRYAGQLLLLYLGFNAVQHVEQGLSFGSSSPEQKMISWFENSPASAELAANPMIQQLGRQAAQPLNALYQQAMVPIAMEMDKIRNGELEGGKDQTLPPNYRPLKQRLQSRAYASNTPNRPGFVQNMELPAAGTTQTSMVIRYE
ncbi:MAG: hypothetical protein FJX22_02125 [Alphaproteobacteria bacterium]|nr:hypothetical protein [Alphaproteobacteria bacterium]